MLIPCRIVLKEFWRRENSDIWTSKNILAFFFIPWKKKFQNWELTPKLAQWKKIYAIVERQCGTSISFYHTLSLTGGPRRPPPSGIGDCSKMHLYIDLKVFDFSYKSKTKILKKKKIRFFYPTPPQRGVLKKWRFWKLVGEPKLQNMICSAIKIRPAYKISVLYL